MSRKIITLKKEALCYQCGTCSSACNTNSIEMRYDPSSGMILPFLDELTCTHCQICEKVCPILNIEGPKYQFNTISTGIYHALNNQLFDASSSGGSTGAILQYLFDSGKIDRAVVTGVEGIYAKPIIIQSASEIANIQGSKYQPVALNSVLKQLEPGQKFAVVGLPCHIDGLKRLIRYNRVLQVDMVVAIGIYCTIGRGFFGTKAALDKQDIRGTVQYRFGDYPGNFGILSKKKFTHISTCVELLNDYDYFFYPRGCHYCDNLYNVNADISIGDTWGLNCGKTGVVMARTENAHGIVDSSVKGKYLAFLRTVSEEENILTQKHSYKYKIKEYYSRMRTINILTNKVLDIASINRNIESKFSIWYFLLYSFTLFSNTRAGYIAMRNVIVRKILVKFRNQLLRRI